MEGSSFITPVTRLNRLNTGKEEDDDDDDDDDNEDVAASISESSVNFYETTQQNI
jgi:hypothetical protein